MSIRRVLIAIALIGLAVLTIYNWPKEKSDQQPEKVEITFAEEEVAEVVSEIVYEDRAVAIAEGSTIEGFQPVSNESDLPAEVNRMSQLFDPYPPLLPIVETVTYQSNVSWVTGRLAYLGDYAAHYHTPKHFISRSLRGTGSYLSEMVSKGDRFNVFRKDKEIEFHTVVDLSRRKLWLYYYDSGEDERVLLKTCPVAVGRLDSRRPSGCLTPTGVFSIGQEGAVYKEGVMGNFKNEQREMITVFGVRWIPLEREMANCTGSCRGLGFHGVPWHKNPETGEYVEDKECLGNYVSGGCIRLPSVDIEEIYAVILSKTSYVHIVKDFQEANLPGKERIF